MKKRLRYLHLLKLEPTETWKPGADEEARILSGLLLHKLGTSSVVKLVSDVAGIFACAISISTLTSTASFVINPVLPTDKTTEELVANLKNVWFDQKLRISFAGDATAECFLLLEIVKTDPETGEHLA